MSIWGKQATAYLTTYLALTLGVLASLCVALIEGVRWSTLQLEAVCITDICMDSVMAEYHRELFKQYNILAIDSSYGTGSIGRANLQGRLAWYLDQNTSRKAEEVLGGFTEILYKDFLWTKLESADLTDYQLLSDGRGVTFRQKAVEALKDDVGLVAVQETLGWLKTVEEYQLDSRDVEAEKRAVDERIAAYQGKEIQLEDEEKTILEFDNPTVTVENRKKVGILWQVMGNQTLSGKVLNQSGLIRQRMKEDRVNEGTVPVTGGTGMQNLTDRVLFGEYLLRYLGNCREAKAGSALEYEIEYVIMGKDADADNLKGVLLRLLAMREAANAAYLFADEKKYEEADLVAMALSAVLWVPELRDLFRTSILFGWAYAESVYDLQILMKGGNVPLIKDETSWHYGLEGLLGGLWEGPEASGNGKGLSYQDYLRILLLLTKEEEQLCRAMNVVEANVRLTPGNKAFRLDGCYVGITARISLRSGFGYHLEIREEKTY